MLLLSLGDYPYYDDNYDDGCNDVYYGSHRIYISFVEIRNALVKGVSIQSITLSYNFMFFLFFFLALIVNISFYVSAFLIVSFF